MGRLPKLPAIAKLPGRRSNDVLGLNGGSGSTKITLNEWIRALHIEVLDPHRDRPPRRGSDGDVCSFLSSAILGQR